MRWGLIASPGEKRQRGFVAALACLGQSVELLPWAVVAADPDRALTTLSACDLVRIEAPGTDEETWSALLATVGAQHSAEGWPSGRLRHRALAAVCAAVAALPRFHSHPDDLLAMADKAETARRLTAAGLPVPERLPPPNDAAGLRSALARVGWPSVFIKPRWGSGGGGIIAYRWQAEPFRTVATTTLHGSPDRPRLGKRLRRLTDPGEIDALMDLVLADGAVVERWIPKLSVAGGPVDLRVLVIAGQARHRIGRQGSGPITNLHLDARRIAPERIFASSPPAAEAAVLDVARRSLACFPGAAYAGVDVLLDRRFRPWIAELNGWGDLLPGLLDAGQDTFTAEIQVVLKAAA